MNIHGSKEIFMSNVKLTDGIISVSELNSRTMSLVEITNLALVNIFQNGENIDSGNITKSREILDLFIKFSPTRFPLSANAYAEYEDQIRKAISNSSPIKFIFIALPFKCFMNPLKTGRKTPDLGEVSMFLRIKSISDAIKRIYQPGAIWTILTEGSLYSKLFKVKEEDIRMYQDGIKNFISALNLGETIFIEELRTVCESNSNFYQTVNSLEKKISKEFEVESDLPKEYYSVLNTMLQSVDTRGLSIEDLYEYQNCIANAKTLDDIRKQWPVFVSQAIDFTIKYLALNKARTILGSNGNMVNDAYPDHCYVSITEKNNRLCFKPISSNGKFLPHHGVPIIKPDGISIVPLMDVLCKKDHYDSLYLTGDVESLPFCYVKK